MSSCLCLLLNKCLIYFKTYAYYLLKVLFYKPILLLISLQKKNLMRFTVLLAL